MQTGLLGRIIRVDQQIAIIEHPLKTDREFEDGRRGKVAEQGVEGTSMKGKGVAVWHGLPSAIVAGVILWLSSQSAADVQAIGVSGMVGTHTGEIAHALEHSLLVPPCFEDCWPGTDER